MKVFLDTVAAELTRTEHNTAFIIWLAQFVSDVYMGAACALPDYSNKG